MSRVRLSVVVPVYCEHDVLPETYRRTKEVLDKLDGDYEMIFVDDGSRDDSFAVLREIAGRDRKVKVVRFSRNFGQQLAVTAGLDYAQGDAVVVMDADLQDDPAMILEFVKKWREGYDVVYNIRGRRQGLSPVKKLGTNVFYGLLRRSASIDIPQNVGLFRLMDRKVVDAIRGMREANRFLPGMFAWAGFKQLGLPSDRPDRAGGRAKSLGKLVSLGMDGILSFSNLPLRIALWLGIVVSSLSFLFGVYAVVRRIVDPGQPLRGWTSTIVIVLFLGGVQLVTMGIIGEYVGRLYDEVKRRPLYVIGEKLNLEGSSPAQDDER